MSKEIEKRPLMARATAVWLLRNTTLTFKQIAQACNLHILELHQLDSSSLQGENPLLNGQLDQETLDRCLLNEEEPLVFRDPTASLLKKKKGGQLIYLQKVL